MIKQFRSFGLASLALMVALVPPSGTPATASGGFNPGPGEARVKLNGRTVAILRTANRGLTPPDRASLATRRLQLFLKGGGRQGVIDTHLIPDGAGVYAGDRLVLVATDAEAEAQRRTPLLLADRWARNLRLALGQTPRDRMSLRRRRPKAPLATTAAWRPIPPDEALDCEATRGEEMGDGRRLMVNGDERSAGHQPSTINHQPSTIAASNRGRSAGETPRRTSINFIRTDIADIVNTLSIQQAVNIALTPNAKGQVTVSLRDVTIEEAVRLISRLAGLDYLYSGDTYVIGTPAELQTMAGRAGTGQIQPLRYLSVQDARELLAVSFPYVTVKPAPGGSGVQLLGTPSDLSAARRSLQEADVSSSAAPLPIETLTPQHIACAQLHDLLGRVLPGVRVVEQGPALILCGSSSTLEQVHKLVSAVDVPVAERKSTYVYDLRYVSADEAVKALKVVLPELLATPSPEPYGPPAAQFNPLSTVLGNSAGANGTSGTGTGASGGLPGSNGLSGAASTYAMKLSRAASVILLGSDGDIAQARAILEHTDVAPSQVLIEARMLELSPDATEKLGISYGDPIAEVTIGENGTRSPSSGLRFGSFGRTPLSFQATLHALLTSQMARLLASPSITVVNNEDASIFIGDLVKYISSQTTDLQGRLQFTIDTQPVGITLLVRPRVNAEGEITMKLHPVVSTLLPGVTLPGGVTLPQVRSREADTTVRLRDGEMLAIGGLISEEQVRAMERVPFLSSLPIIGELFRNRSKTHTRNELTVVLIPRVVRPGQPIPQPVVSRNPTLPEPKGGK